MWKGTSPTNLCWYQKTRMITLSYEINISAVCSIVSSQSTHVTDRQTHGRTEKNYDHHERASTAASHGKKACNIAANVGYLTVLLCTILQMLEYSDHQLTKDDHDKYVTQ